MTSRHEVDEGLAILEREGARMPVQRSACGARGRGLSPPRGARALRHTSWRHALPRAMESDRDDMARDQLSRGKWMR